MQDELLNAAILLRRGSWVDPELFERAAKRMAELESRLVRCGELRKANGEIAISLHGWKNGERRAYVAEQLPQIAAALRRDAERYRQLKAILSGTDRSNESLQVEALVMHAINMDDLDAAIDAALAEVSE